MRELVPSPPVHLRPHQPVAERVVLPGDPGRALRIAQQLLDQPRMLNHHRGLWGYTGEAADGSPLTVQSTGLGGPSTAIVIEELIALGARRLVRAGTCRGLGGTRPGELVIAAAAICEDGTSRALGAGPTALPDAGLTAALRLAAPGARAGDVVSGDLFYERAPGTGAGTTALATDLETAAAFAAGARAGAAVAAILAVTRRTDGEAPGLSDDRMAELEAELGRAALAALR